MKILIIVLTLTEGGAERVAASWANGLSKRGHQVYVLTNPEGQTYPLHDEVTIIKRKYFAGKNVPALKKLGRKFIEIKADFDQIRGIINEIGPDVVLDVLNVSAIPLLLARRFSRGGTSLIMTDHCSYERPKGDEFTFKHKFDKFFINRLFDAVTVLTKRDKELLTEKGVRNIEVLYNPLFFKPVAKVPVKEKVILAVGRINAWRCKGFDLLIQAWDKIALKYPDWKLRIVGDGSPASIEYLKGFAHDSAGQMEFAPFTKDIVDEYRKASVFVMSSRYEGWGLVMIEAMSQGCAVIACDYKGRQAEAITDGFDGVLCEVNNSDEIARKISLLIEDDELRTSLQQNAINAVDFYHEDKVAERLEKLIDKYRPA